MDRWTREDADYVCRVFFGERWFSDYNVLRKRHLHRNNMHAALLAAEEERARRLSAYEASLKDGTNA